TMLIYDMVEHYSLKKDMKLPYMPLNCAEPDRGLFEKYADKILMLKDFYTSEFSGDRHLVRAITESLEANEDFRTEEMYEHLDVCLDTIKKSSEKMNTHWSAYLLQMADYIDLIWEKGDSLVGVARGSGTGFGLLNVLGITQINPLNEKTKTYPWRFLNPERASVLDIDSDIEANKRDKIMQVFKDTYGEDRVSKVLTYTTEGPRSAILTVARGLGIDNDIASYIASLIVADRGTARSLHTMYYGDDDNAPVSEFVNVMNEYPELWEGAQKIEGLISGVGSHAGGIIFVDEPFTETTALMKTNNGDTVTQFDLHEAEKCGLIKIDMLSTEAESKIRTELDLLLKDGRIEWQGSLRKTYEKYIGVRSLERDDPEMWKLLWEHKIISLFQMEKDSGVQAISLARPSSVDDLCTLNSVIRLMAQEEGAEAPLHKFARFKQDISQWYKEMEQAGLTKDEQELLKGILETSYGICAVQEIIMILVMHPQIGGFSLAWADRLRKAIAKKNPKDFVMLEAEFFNNAEAKNLSKSLTRYVWFTLIYTQRGYGFNCVSGNTVIMRGGANDRKPLTVKEMCLIKNLPYYAIQTHHESLRNKYLTNGYGYSLSLFDDGKVRGNKIVDIRSAGVRQTYRITCESGAIITCTENHKIPTKDGIRYMYQLKVGDYLYHVGECDKSRNSMKLTDGNWEDNYPKKGEQGFRKKAYSPYAAFKEIRNQHKTDRDSCDVCGKAYEGKFELHHRDGNRTNNDPANLQWLCRSCHKKAHYQMGHIKKYKKGRSCYFDRIVKIKPYKEELVYDIEMADPAHNFTLDNGLIVCNSAHTLAYSMVALQEMNLAYKYPIIYWNTANLLVDSGSLEGEDKTTRYGKMAIAIANMRQNGIKVELPLINEAERGFVPNVEKNEIFFSFKAINGVGDADVEAILSNRPYASMKDFCRRMIKTKQISNSVMVALIKSGAFEQLHNPDRKVTMEWYLRNYVFDPNTSITMANLKRMLTMGIIPSEYKISLQVWDFKSYVLDERFLHHNVVNRQKKVPKCGYHDRIFKLDARAMVFFKEHFSEGSIESIEGSSYLISEKKFGKECDAFIEPMKTWFKSDECLSLFNDAAFKEIWNKHASGSVAAWDMSALSFYYNEHELCGIDLSPYGVVNYFDLPEQPVVYDSSVRYINGGRKFIPKFEIVRIAGTVLNADNNHHTVALLTTEGVVNVKFNKGHYAFYNKQISARLDPNSDKKTVLEKSWFKRGTLLLVSGYRQGDNFRSYRYKDTIYQHTVCRINEIKSDGTLDIQSERARNDE
ncbi:MAG: HNH endonuclease, partial [Bacteroidales bacterium]|nr:HNH endonuclease [Bacteroidales bacterium]